MLKSREGGVLKLVILQRKRDKAARNSSLVSVGRWVGVSVLEVLLFQKLWMTQGMKLRTIHYPWLQLQDSHKVEDRHARFLSCFLVPYRLSLLQEKPVGCLVPHIQVILSGYIVRAWHKLTDTTITAKSGLRASRRGDVCDFSVLRQ